MEKEKLESQLIDYIDGKLSHEEILRIEKAISDDAAVRKIYEELKEVVNVIDSATPAHVPPAVKTNFEQWLVSEISRAGKAKTVYMKPWFLKIAAAVALVIVGAGLGYWLSGQQGREREMLALRKEMEATRQIVMSMLNNELSPGERIMGVKTASANIKDDAIVNALIRTMNEDPNANVRLAAIDALGKFHHEEKVRKALIESLYHQTDPVVQVTLIQWMVVLKEKEAIGPLQHIIEDENSMQSVRDEAHAGIFKLS